MWTVRIGLVGLVALAAACGASRSSPASPAPKPGAATAEAAEPARSKTRVVLGSATGLSKTSLLLPAGIVPSSWQVRLLADPIGGASPIRTPALLVAPGQSVYWTIGSDPANSFASVG